MRGPIKPGLRWRKREKRRQRRKSKRLDDEFERVVEEHGIYMEGWHEQYNKDKEEAERRMGRMTKETEWDRKMTGR